MKDMSMVPHAIVDTGRSRMGINYLLFNQMTLDRWAAIQELHFWRLCLHELMEDCPKKDLRDYDDLYTGLELELQRRWGFEMDVGYHRWWRRPRCTCPPMDNADRYPGGPWVVSNNCPLHYWMPPKGKKQ